jgi:predicted phosphodiesterase
LNKAILYKKHSKVKGCDKSMLIYAMKIGLISDTHDNIQNIQNAITSFLDKHVRIVIHAGDIVSPETVETFDGMILIGVLGNNDL